MRSEVVFGTSRRYPSLFQVDGLASSDQGVAAIARLVSEIADSLKDTVSEGRETKVPCRLTHDFVF